MLIDVTLGNPLATGLTAVVGAAVAAWLGDDGTAAESVALALADWAVACIAVERARRVVRRKVREGDMLLGDGRCCCISLRPVVLSLLVWLVYSRER